MDRAIAFFFTATKDLFAPRAWAWTIAFCAAGFARPPPARAAAPAAALVEVGAQDRRLRFDLVYASPNNFVGRALYGARRCLLRPAVARRLVQAQAHLSQRHPGLHLLLKDCYRPLRVQRQMYAALAGTPQRAYVANPDHPTGGVHTYGAAVDVTLCDGDGRELDMGTPHDHFGPLAEPRRETELAASGQLSAAALRHRRWLRQAMLQGGHFRPIRREWWHFDAWQGAALRARYRRLDLPLAAAPGGEAKGSGSRQRPAAAPPTE